MLKRVAWPIALLVFFSFGSTVQAQQNSEARMQTEISFVWGFAQGAFGDNLDRPLPGLALSFGGKVPRGPLVLSTELGWFSNGFDDRLELLFTNAASSPSTSVFNINTRNSILMAHFVARLAPIRGPIAPFVDGLVGFKYISSGIDVQSQVLINDTDGDIVIIDGNRLSTSSNFDALAVSYGAGAGVNIQVYGGRMGVDNSYTTLSLHLGARYLFGSEADYLTENSIITTADGVRFERAESNTDILIPELGFHLGF